jgi:hypothetical protein
MSSSSIERRLRRLEIQEEGEGSVFVVDGYSEEEHDAKIADMEQRREIGRRDIIVKLVNFCEPPERLPGVVCFCDGIK